MAIAIGKSLPGRLAAMQREAPLSSAARIIGAGGRTIRLRWAECRPKNVGQDNVTVADAQTGRELIRRGLSVPCAAKSLTGHYPPAGNDRDFIRVCGVRLGD